MKKLPLLIMFIILSTSVIAVNPLYYYYPLVGSDRGHFESAYATIDIRTLSWGSDIIASTNSNNKKYLGVAYEVTVDYDSSAQSNVRYNNKYYYYSDDDTEDVMNNNPPVFPALIMFKCDSRSSTNDYFVDLTKHYTNGWTGVFRCKWEVDTCSSNGATILDGDVGNVEVEIWSDIDSEYQKVIYRKYGDDIESLLQYLYSYTSLSVFTGLNYNDGSGKPIISIPFNAYLGKKYINRDFSLIPSFPFVSYSQITSDGWFNNIAPDSNQPYVQNDEYTNYEDTPIDNRRIAITNVKHTFPSSGEWATAVCNNITSASQPLPPYTGTLNLTNSSDITEDDLNDGGTGLTDGDGFDNGNALGETTEDCVISGSEPDLANIGKMCRRDSELKVVNNFSQIYDILLNVVILIFSVFLIVFYIISFVIIAYMGFVFIPDIFRKIKNMLVRSAKIK